jgi:hypothetical protein
VSWAPKPPKKNVSRKSFFSNRVLVGECFTFVHPCCEKRLLHKMKSSFRHAEKRFCKILTEVHVRIILVSSPMLW